MTSRIPERRRITELPKGFGVVDDAAAPLSNRPKFLIVIAIAALLTGYFFVFGDSDHPVNVAIAPHIPPINFLPLQEAEVPPAKADITVESGVEPEGQTASLQPTARSGIEPPESEIETRPPLRVPDKGRRLFVAKQGASTCFPSASAVRENHPGAWPSWTFRAHGHESTRCWYAATRMTAHRHRTEMRRKETVPATEKFEVPPLLGVQ